MLGIVSNGDVCVHSLSHGEFDSFAFECRPESTGCGTDHGDELRGGIFTEENVECVCAHVEVCGMTRAEGLE